MKYVFNCAALVVSLSIIFWLPAFSQQPNDQSKKSNLLYQIVAKLDSVMFSSYNKRDLDGLMGFFSPDLEFYDDRKGLSNYEYNAAAFERNFTDTNHSSRRELINGSLEVYRLGDFGALAIGTHKFYGTVNGKEELEATAKFTEIWENNRGVWKIKRVMSYDHK